jgi:hypothetical protein
VARNNKSYTWVLKLLIMKYYLIIYKGKLIGESGESCDSTYELQNACTTCGTNAQLTGNLIAKRISNVKLDFFQTIDRDYLLSDKLFNFLKKRGLKIEPMVRVIDLKKEETGFYYFKSNFNLPKTTHMTTGLKTEDQCPICKRNGYYNDVKYQESEEGIKKTYPPIHLVYGNIKDDLLESSDIFNTWEHFGLSNLKIEGIKVLRYARPMLVVSELIKRAFEEYDVKNALFEEVKMD